jgi:glycosyltransferase involved in cell wall biosynthesis
MNAKPSGWHRFVRHWKDGNSGEKLFVLIGAHNHENFISRAIEGALAQGVDLPFQILVRDDASTDRTRDIVSAYARQHPKKIVPILYAVNQNAVGRGWTNDLFYRVSNRTRFTRKEKAYVALCEGDDFWIDSTKLQRQVDFLRDHPTAAVAQRDFQLSRKKTG